MTESFSKLLQEMFSTVKVIFRWISSLSMEVLKVEEELRFWTPVLQKSMGQSYVISAHCLRHFREAKYPLENPNTYFSQGFL